MGRTMAAAVVVAIGLAGAAGPAPAADGEGRYSVKGAGLATCERFVAERDKKSELSFLFAGWLNGYLSAYNRLAPETFDISGWRSTQLLIAFLVEHCKKNPQLPFHAAVSAMVSALEKSKLARASEVVEAENDGKKVRLYRDVLVEVQKALKAKGLYQGEPDGAYGPGTKAALEAFQTEAKIPVTGLPEQRTLYMLFRPEG